MNPKDLQKKSQTFFKKNRKTVARIMHYIPAPPLIHLIFDVTFPRMVAKRNYKKFKGVHTDFQFTFSEMPGRKSWVLEIDDGKVRVTRGEADYPHMVINSSARDFIDLTSGYLPETTAMMSGRLAVNGGPASKLKMVMGLFG
jgi:putative sterol carrier protein